VSIIIEFEASQDKSKFNYIRQSHYLQIVIIAMKIFFVLIGLLLSFHTYSQSELENLLFELPNVIFKKIATPDGYESAYELKIRQPIDHKDKSKGHFYQRAFLSHKAMDAPTAMITNGYGRPTNRVTEVARLIEANQINIEHRYFLESSPDSLDYDYLNFEQVAADLHHINQLFRKIYDGKWVSSGISKGGTTTIIYRYFYPEDVDISIPYVAPINHSDEDRRIYDFLAKVGTKECRADIHDYQIVMLEKAEEMKSFLKWFAKGQRLEFNYLDLDQAYEYAILEYPFSFWQWGADCDDIPATNAPVDTLLQHFVDIVGLEFYSDASMDGFGSHYYQSAEEMGYYGFEIQPFKDLLHHLNVSSNPSAIFTPDKIPVKFDGKLTNEVFAWTQKTDLPFIYINGANDTWSATAVPEVKSSESLWFFMKNKSHGDARIKNMTPSNKLKLQRTLSNWIGSEIDCAILDK